MENLRSSVKEAPRLVTSPSGNGNKRARGIATMEHLKRTAETLFARNGVDAVTVRDIVKAAGVRNVASLNYYFGGKEGLVRELVMDGAMASDHWRLEQLERLSMRGHFSIRDIVRVLAWPLLEIEPVRFATGTHMRFINNLVNVNRKLFDDTVAGRWNLGYQRCLGMLRERSTLPAQTLNERFILLHIYVRGVWAAREAEVERHPADNLWNQPHMIRQVLGTIESLLTAPSPR